MRLKLDENLPVELAEFLASLNHTVDTVASEFLTGSDDATVFQAASSDGRILMTQDLDFADMRKFAPGTHPGIILVRLRDPSRRRLMEKLQRVFASEPVETWAGCFIVVSDRKLRIRRPR